MAVPLKAGATVALYGPVGVFLQSLTRAPRTTAVAGRQKSTHNWRPEDVRGFNYLLCMFNGFAMPKPFCGRIKA
jgi:hypothetical protein